MRPRAPRATLAIARREMSPAWRAGVAQSLATGLGLALGFHATAPGVPHDALFAFAIFFGAGSGLQTRVFDLTYFSAPLYGRQLARAHAVTAIMAALALPAGALLASVRGLDAAVASTLACAALASVVAALVGLSGTLRTGWARIFYGVIGCVAGAFVVLPERFATHDAFGLSLALALALGFVALRAFGETLARYDPLP